MTSGTGVLGYRVAISLLEAGHTNVRVGIWGFDSGRLAENSFGKQCADELLARGAEVIDFDWSHPELYGKALKDVKTVFCSLPHIRDWSDAFPAFLRQCKAKKVEHFVKISFLRPTHSFKGVARIAKQYRDNVPVRALCTLRFDTRVALAHTRLAERALLAHFSYYYVFPTVCGLSFHLR